MEVREDECLWDYINRAMPLGEQARTLTASKVYCPAAYVLRRNSVIDPDDVMDASTLPPSSNATRSAEKVSC